MTLSLIGGHFTKNGIGKNYPARCVLSIQGNGLDEQHQDTIVLFRDVTVHTNGPSDLHTHPLRRTIEFAQYWYDQLKPIWQANTHRANYFTITNELGGSDPEHIQDHIAFEENICHLAYADGLKCAVGKLAGDSPTWDTDLWEIYYLPHIVKMWDDYGAVYARHVYGGDLVRDGKPTNDPPGNPERPFLEVDLLRAVGYRGGMVIAECGLDGGYGVADYERFSQQVLAYEQALKPYADIIIGVCWWECGDTEDFEADYTNHIQTIKPRLDKTFPKWEGGESMSEETLHEHLQRVALEAQTVSYNKDAALQKAGNRDGFGITGSETRTEYEGIKYAVQPFGDLRNDSERYYYSVVDDWGNVKRGDLRGDEEPTDPSPQPPMVYRPSDTQRITQKFGNNPDGYPMWGGCGHGGIDIGVAMGWPFYATRGGTVIHASDRRWSSNTPSGYGYHVVIDHGDCKTVYAHARQDLPVKVGDNVTAGTIVGYSGNTGNSEGYHEHYSILVNEQTGCHPQTVMGWFIDPEYVMSLPKPVEPPPTGQSLDITPYFKPAGTHGIYTVFHFSDGRTQSQQAENLPDGRTILWKGEGQSFDGNPKTYYDYEEIMVDSEGVKKGTDTSDARLDGKMAYSLNWVIWLPKICHVGTVYPSSPIIQEFDRTNCQPVNSTTTVDYIYFREIIPLWISPYNSEIRFTNVPVFEWRKTDDINTPAIEVYKFAVNVFYCEWNNGAVGELPQGRQPLSFELTDC